MPGAIDTSADDDQDDTGGGGNDQDTDDQGTPAIPATDDTEPTPASMDQPQDQGGQTVPGAAQSGGAGLSELLALVRAVSQYGLRMAQNPSQGQAQGGGQQTPSYASGGMVRSFEDGGVLPTDTPPEGEGTAPPEPEQSAPAAPPSPTEAALDTRQMALQKSGLGGAFGAAQQGKIDAARQNYQGGLGANTNSPGGEHDISGSPEPSPGAVSTARGMPPLHEQMQGSSLGQAAGKLVKYLQGDRAMDPNTTSAIAYAVDPQGLLPPVERKMKMIQYAYTKVLQQTQDPGKAMDGALGMLQHQRKEYDMWRTAAAVKMSQSDVGSAVDAANKAFQAPFGDNVHFQQSTGGSITATVTDDKGAVQGTFPLQHAQFHQLMSQHGKFDSLVTGGVLNTLAKLATPAGPQGETTPVSASQWQRGTPAQQAQAQAPQGQERDLPILKAPPGTDQATFDQSKRIFPWVSQNSQREGWVAGEQEKEKERGAKVQAAQTTNDARMARTQMTQQGAMERTEARDKASMDRTQLREEKHDARFDKGWENRTQAAIIKQAGQNRSDPSAARKTAIAKSLLAEHTGDPEGYKTALKQYGIDYDKDILGTAPTGAGPVPGAAQSRAPAATAGAPGGKAQVPGTSPGGQWVRNKATGAVEWRAASAPGAAAGEQ